MERTFEGLLESGLHTLNRLYTVCGEVTEADVNTVVGSAGELLEGLDCEEYRAQLKERAGSIWPR